MGYQSQFGRNEAKSSVMRLHTAGKAEGFRKPIVARIVTDAVPRETRQNVALVTTSLENLPEWKGYAAVIVPQRIDHTDHFDLPLVHSVRDVDHLKTGHIVVLEPSNGFIRTLYRPDSEHNTLFTTERCNSNCLMCSQPPSSKDDIAAMMERNLKLIDLIIEAPNYLCITGGEPTLLGDELFTIVERLRDKFPSTYVHMLTNGRRFGWAEYTRKLGAISHPQFSVGIPLYSDHADQHDYVVQSRNAFDQTILGLHHLARNGIEVEIRVVLHALTVRRLPQLADYICRNLTFVDHVAFMGMEHIGYAPRNMSKLWIDPVDYQEQLERSVTVLSRFGIDVRIYNLQLCILKKSLWKFAKQAISDWKNSYADVCDTCTVKNQCGGFFQWNTNMPSREIHAIAAS